MDSVNLGGTHYKIKTIKNLSKKKRLHGQILYDECVIELNATDNKQLYANTLLHECLHGIFADRDLEQSEKLVNGLSNGLIQLFRENPELVEMIKGAFEPPSSLCGRDYVHVVDARTRPCLLLEFVFIYLIVLIST